MKKATLVGIAPVLVVPDVVQTAEYYCKVLGFNLISYFMNPPVYAMVERDGYQVHFGNADGTRTQKNSEVRKISTDIIIWVPEIDSFYEELKSRKADISPEISQRLYGREFIITDCNGFKIAVID